MLAVLLLGIVGAMWREWFAVGWWAGIGFLFAAIGAAQWRLAASRHHRKWHPFLFTTLDAALIAFLLLWPNPIGPPMAFEIEMLTCSYTFVFFTVLLAMSSLSFSWARGWHARRGAPCAPVPRSARCLARPRPAGRALGGGVRRIAPFAPPRVYRHPCR